VSVRWECPNGKHPGVLGSTRPRADAVVRYCLPCSQAEGRLVKRTAPSLERKRAASALRSSEKRATAEKAARQRERERWIVWAVAADGERVELDVFAFIERCMRLPEIRERWAATRDELVNPEPPSWRPEVKIIRSKAIGSGCSGRAWWYDRMVLRFGPTVPLERAQELILHELVHVICNYHEHHGTQFRVTLLRAARELWPGALDGVRNDGRTYDMDARIWQAARRAAERKVQ
jgi:hypothetical protein